MVFRCAILTFLTFFVYPGAQTQVDWPVIAMGEERGMRCNTIYDLFQAENGYLYAGTNNGLFRFNGISFEACKIPGESQELANIVELPNHQIITRNFYGSTFILQGKTLCRTELLPECIFGYPTYQKDGDKIYRSEQSRLNLIMNGNQLAYQSFDIPSLSNSISALNLIRNDTLYVIRNASDLVSSICLDLKSGKIIAQLPLRESTSNIRYFEHGGTIYLLDGPSASVIPFKSGRPNSEKITLPGYDPSEKIGAIKSLSDGSLLIGTFSGIYQYTSSFELKGKYMNGMQVSSLYEDQEKNLWIGTLMDGLFMVPSPDVTCVKLPADFKISTTEKIHDSLLVVGSFDGRLLWVDDQGTIKRSIDLDMEGEIQSLSYSAEEDYLYVHCVNFLILDNSTGKIVQKLPGYSTKDFYISKDYIYAATSAGVRCVSKYDQEAITRGSHLWVRRCTPYQNQLFLETDDGLKSLNLETHALRDIPLRNERGNALIPLNLSAHQGNIYFTVENAIYRFDPNSDQASLYHTVLKPIELLAFQGETLITYDGLELRFDHPDSVYMLDAGKGLIDHTLTQINVLGNKLFISSNRGISIFEKFKPKNNRIPTLSIQNFTGTFRREDSLYISEFDENRIELKFELLPNLASLGKGQVYYRFLGIDSTWKTLTAADNFTLKQERLPSGYFQMEAYGVNEDGVESNQLVLKFRVRKPFYATWWFIALMILSISALTWFLIQRRVSGIKQKDLENLEKERLKIKALNAELLAIRAQMNPHFIFNSISSIQNKILDKENEQAYENLSTFSKLLRQALQFTRHEFIRLSDELEFLENYIALEQMRTDNGFYFSQKIDNQLPLSALEFPALLTQPFAENAIRHGLMHSKRKKILELDMHATESGYRVVIRDNGIGRQEAAKISPRNEQHISFATQAVKDRIDIINRGKKMHISLNIIDLDQGTEIQITVRFPVHKTSAV